MEELRSLFFNTLFLWATGIDIDRLSFHIKHISSSLTRKLLAPLEPED